MEASYPKLTAEQLDAIAASGGLPVRVEDPATHKIYLLVDQLDEITLDNEYLQAELSKGIAALDAGERVPWDPDRIKREGRQRLAGRKTSD